MLKPEAVEKLVAALKAKVGQKIKLAMHNTVRDDSFGGGGLCPPRHEDSEEVIIFLGVYGLGQQPLYIHGVDDKGKAVIFRNDTGIVFDEDIGRLTQMRHTDITNLDDVEIGQWFRNGVDRYDKQALAFIKKMEALVPKESYLAEKLLEGKIDYHPPSGRPYYYPSDFKLVDPGFVEKALAHLDRIV